MAAQWVVLAECPWTPMNALLMPAHESYCTAVLYRTPAGTNSNKINQHQSCWKQQQQQRQHRVRQLQYKLVLYTQNDSQEQAQLCATIPYDQLHFTHTLTQTERGKATLQREAYFLTEAIVAFHPLRAG